MVDSPPEAVDEARGPGLRGRLGTLRRFDRPALAIALLALAFALLRAWSQGGDIANIDYYQYWVVGHALRWEQPADIYSAQERVRLARRGWREARREARELERETLRLKAAEFRREELHTYSTPWLYSVFARTISHDYDADQLRFQRVSLVCLVFSLLALTRLVGASPLVSVLWTLFVVAGFEPVASEVRVGNVNRIQVLLVTLALLALRLRAPTLRPLLVGLVLSQAVLFKPSLGAVGLLLAMGWLLSGRFKEIALAGGGALAGGVIAIGLSSAYFPSLEVWASWLREVPSLLSEFDHNVSKGNFSLVRIAEDLLGWGSSLAFSLVFVAGVAFVALLPRFLATSGSASGGETNALRANDAFSLDCLMVGFGGLMPVLTSDLAWYHYFVLTLPLFVFVLRPQRVRASALRTALRGLGVASLLCVALAPLRPLVGAPGPIVVGTMAAGGALCLYGIALYELFAHARNSDRPSTLPAD